jgi:predicted TIM-barrel fold metal-dependent hydrolase
VFDTHFHIIDMRYPVQENQGFFPPSFPAPDYLERTKGLGISGGNVVSGFFRASTPVLCTRRCACWGLRLPA